MSEFVDGNIRFYLESYRRELMNFWDDEKYKWIAVKCFQDNWNIEHPDFGEMLKLATSKQVNLLSSGMYFPLGMLQEFINVDQERVRNMFRMLYDEDKDLIERIRYYQNEAELLRLTDVNKWKNHYQDLRAVSVLLWLRFPDKYYIYKSKEFRKTIESIDADFSHKEIATPQYYVRFLDIMNAIRDEISKDGELTNTLHELVQSTSGAYEDKNLHVATVDFVFYVGKRYENNQSLIDDKLQSKMGEQRKLQIGDMSDNGQITIVDEDRLCYIVRNENHGAVGLRTISKALLSEFVSYVEEHPDANGNEAKNALSGYSDIDKFEYGYNATYVMMAKMVLGFVKVIGNDASSKTPTKYISGKLQQIYYGAPGTGKSHIINEQVCNESVIRTTFHPDSDYASFVGCYKPKAKDLTDGGSEITYDFVPQAFTKAYIAAWKDTSKPYYLVIEEINRGNCAQIFGDLFQLLDRREDGFSSYEIVPDTDLQQYLAKEFTDVDIDDEKIKAGESMRLPSNLYILATMNTSDQSLFPIDSAFKRRWDWKYIPIKNEVENHKIVVGEATYDWWNFVKFVNDRIESVTDSEDKQIGYWFAKANDKKEISAEILVSKVFFYLWNDVFKDYAHSKSSLFQTEKRKYKFREFYLENGDVNINLLNQFLMELGLKNETPQSEETQSTEE